MNEIIDVTHNTVTAKCPVTGCDIGLTVHESMALSLADYECRQHQVNLVIDKPAPTAEQCLCPFGLGRRYHRAPCPRAGEVETVPVETVS